MARKPKRERRIQKKEREYIIPEVVSREDILFWRSLIIKTIIAVAILIAFFLLMQLLFADQIALIGKRMSSRMGYMGMAIYTFVVDMFVLPATIDFLFIFARQYDPFKLILVLGLASAAGGIGGYALSRSMGHLPVFRNALEHYRDKGELLIKRYGGWAVFIAAVTPIPFSTVVWISGLLKVPFYEVALACLARVPRVALYYYISKTILRVFGA